MNATSAKESDLAGIRWLLAAEHLPIDDLTERSLKNFIVLREGGQLAGVIGLENYGEAALLRSLVIAPEQRARGYGVLLTSAIESVAQAADVRSIYLLTTSAEKFFSTRGYRRIERALAPAAIQATTQFSALCPATAVLMVKP